MKPVITRVAERFQVTVPTEIRDIFDLRVGDLLEWQFENLDGNIRLSPKRAQLITPSVREWVASDRQKDSPIPVSSEVEELAEKV